MIESFNNLSIGNKIALVAAVAALVSATAVIIGGLYKLCKWLSRKKGSHSVPRSAHTENSSEKKGAEEINAAIVAKQIDDCQTPEELSEAIAYHLKQGGMRRDYYDQTGLVETKYDEFETKRLYGFALNKYNEICKLYPNFPSPQIATSDSLSGLAQIQQLLLEGCKKTELETDLCVDSLQKQAETGQENKEIRSDQGGVQQFCRKVKKHPFVAILLIFVAFVIGLAAFTDSIGKLWQLGSKWFPQSKHAISDAPKPNAPVVPETSLVNPKQPLPKKEPTKGAEPLTVPPSISRVSLKAYINTTDSERRKLENMLVEWEGYVSSDIQEKVVDGEMWYMFRLVERLPEKYEIKYSSLEDLEVQCYFDHTQKKHVAKLESGSPVKVKGLIVRKDSFVGHSSLLNVTDVINCTLLTDVQSAPKKSDVSILPKTKNLDIDVLVASLKNISSDFHASASVIRGVSNLNRRITGSELVRILKAANISSDAYYYSAK